MTKFEQALSENGLLTGQAESDTKLVAAYELGIRHGEDADRKSIQRAAQVDTTLRIMVVLMRQMGKDLEEVMVLLQIPKQDRDIYRKVLGKRKPKEKNSCL